ncbi:hypothetical protein GCM10025868_19020 [Angustibacter aerolatus]|uniref:NADPH-dependent FMN reductase-like domain-containing protein n=1 Tax=Angustibacter aerolatus TaxID=1162965 RepID=A0ABQ6JEL9_9ACTN|nr:hypothetical protein GCM10025868_19020 [Angustibacter aerolatus]
MLVVATPTYKGAYTGLLKSFLDHVGADALAGAVAVPVTTVGGPAHTLAADVHLRPLLLEPGRLDAHDRAGGRRAVARRPGRRGRRVGRPQRRAGAPPRRRRCPDRPSCGAAPGCHRQ